jgi:two-component system response regulator ChvI
MNPRIALVDDDKNILTSVAMALEAEGFSVLTYDAADKAIAFILRDPPDLVVMDIKMPRMDGLTALREIRAASAVPVVFLTSKDEEIDQFAGLRAGADDYITKPFSQRLLIERLRVILRRHKAASATSVPVVRGSLSFDEERFSLKWKGQAIDLTVTEFLMVKTLAAQPGHVKSRDQLMDAAYGVGVYADDRTIDTHIKRIRRKFKEADPSFDAIETVYGAGYRFKDAP